MITLRPRSFKLKCCQFYDLPVTNKTIVAIITLQCDRFIFIACFTVDHLSTIVFKDHMYYCHWSSWCSGLLLFLLLPLSFSWLFFLVFCFASELYHKVQLSLQSRTFSGSEAGSGEAAAVKLHPSLDSNPYWRGEPLTPNPSPFRFVPLLLFTSPAFALQRVRRYTL